MIIIRFSPCLLLKTRCLRERAHDAVAAARRVPSYPGTFPAGVIAFCSPKPPRSSPRRRAPSFPAGNQLCRVGQATSCHGAAQRWSCLNTSRNEAWLFLGPRLQRKRVDSQGLLFCHLKKKKSLLDLCEYMPYFGGETEGVWLCCRMCFKAPRAHRHRRSCFSRCLLPRRGTHSAFQLSSS